MNRRSQIQEDKSTLVLILLAFIVFYCYWILYWFYWYCKLLTFVLLILMEFIGLLVLDTILGFVCIAKYWFSSSSSSSDRPRSDILDYTPPSFTIFHSHTQMFFLDSCVVHQLVNVCSCRSSPSSLSVCWFP